MKETNWRISNATDSRLEALTTKEYLAPPTATLIPEGPTPGRSN
jgi:hypothetical protein